VIAVAVITVAAAIAANTTNALSIMTTPPPRTDTLPSRSTLV
jgi:hypothetical protein